MRNIKLNIRILSRIFLLLLFCVGVPSDSKSQNLALKTNLLYWGTLTPNIGVEMSLSSPNTLQLFYGLHPWRSTSGRSLRHWVLQPEYRHWFCEAFNGWFLGAHLLGGEFNVGNVDLPTGLFNNLKEHRYEGHFMGGGVSFGYQWPISRHWNFEASLGLGYAYIVYDKYKCGECGEKLNSSNSHYFGPTKAALSLLYIF